MRLKRSVASLHVNSCTLSSSSLPHALLCNCFVRASLLFSLFLIPVALILFVCCPYVHTSLPPSPQFSTNHVSSVLQTISRHLNKISLPLARGRAKPKGFGPVHSPRNFLTILSLLIILAGDVHPNPGPTTPSVNLVNLNTRSITAVSADINKPVILQQFILDYNIDFLTLTETWLPPDPLPATINSLLPPGYCFLHSPRLQGRGGGLAIIHKSLFRAANSTTPKFTSFEVQCVTFAIPPSSTSIIVINIYRPPSTSLSVFLPEFSTLLEDYVTTPSELIITGDFNLHVDQPNAPSVSSFLDLLDSFGLKQHVNFPTHPAGHTLDLLITRSASDIVANVYHSFPSISDHYAVHSQISIPFNRRPPSRVTKQIRPLGSIDPVLFSSDILASDLYLTSSTSLDSTAYLNLFNNTMATLLDKHAPLKSISCPNRPHKPFITPEILKEKSIRSRLETIYRKFKSNYNKTLFKLQSRKVAKMITDARRVYFRNLITSCSHQPKKLWSSLNHLLSRNPRSILPNHTSPTVLASSFLQFFDDKITRLCSTFQPSAPPPPSAPPIPPPLLSHFSPATADEVKSAILSSSDATCSLDIIPTRLLKSCLDSLVIPITTIINLSLSEGSFPTVLKSAIITPTLKKHNLPPDDLASYRPISNLNFISKILERVIYTRLTNHLQSFPSLSPFQSAYRKFHSTETALLRIQNDLLASINERKLSALVLLDLSAAFDTIDHTILLSRLESYFGITGSALGLLSSYLSDRSQSVKIESSLSAPLPLTTGVPQGSVLGPLLFCLYTTPLTWNPLSSSPVSFHLYADDTQLYISFTSNDSPACLKALSTTLDSVYSWFTNNRLSLNPAKTEYLVIGTKQQRSKLVNASISFSGTVLTPTNSARNLGVIFESDLSLKKHISKICQASFLQIRQLRQIRSSLDINTATILANSLVSSKIDYCNSLYFGLPATSINRLQKIQNSLARVVYPSVKRHHHITPTLRKLHWLPVTQRIQFKIASITFKTLQYKQPSYLFELLTPHVPSKSVRSSEKQLLVVPRTTSSNGRRSFAYAAPYIWNSLPLALRSTTSLPVFLRGLKTHLFPP